MARCPLRDHRSDHHRVPRAGRARAAMSVVHLHRRRRRFARTARSAGCLPRLVNWHWIFFINLPIGVVTFWLGAILSTRPRASASTRASTCGFGPRHRRHGARGLRDRHRGRLRLGLIHTLGFGATSIALLRMFMVLEGRIANPIMPLRVFRIPGRLDPASPGIRRTRSGRIGFAIRASSTRNARASRAPSRRSRACAPSPTRTRPP